MLRLGQNYYVFYMICRSVAGRWGFVSEVEGASCADSIHTTATNVYYVLKRVRYRPGIKMNFR